MTTNATLKDHADLVDRMADALGLDLEEVMMEGRMDIEQLSDAVLSCTGCTQPDTCRHWLDEQGNPSSEAPGYCRNGDMFARLKAGKTA